MSQALANTYFYLIILNVAASWLVWQRNNLYQYSLQPALVWRGQWYRMISSMFIHKNGMHLLFNMMALYFFGPVVHEMLVVQLGPELGTVHFVAMYMLGGLVANVPTLIRHKADPNHHSVGASGAIAAVIFAFIVRQPMQDICLYFVICLPGILLGGLFLAYSAFRILKPGDDNINHEAHFYGAVFGAEYMFLI